MTARFSVVIPAHDEASVIGRTLRFAADLDPDEAEIVVVANGCRDATAATAAAVPGVRVVEVAAASKTAALNAGDDAASSFPRIYLDADIDITAATLRRMSTTLDADAPRICSPTITFRTEDRPWAVRAYHRVYAQLPYVRGGLVGGAYGVSEAGRRRFGRFPAITNDDTFVQRLFRPDERVVLAGDSFGVHAPRSLRALLAVRTRVAAGNAQLAGTGAEHLSRTSSGTAGALARLLAQRPVLAPAALVYGLVTVAAELRARRAPDPGWLRDRTTRAPSTPPVAPSTEPAIAYLVSLYPALSHEFISREVRAMRASGVRVRTFSVRPAGASDALTADNRVEQQVTRTLLGEPGSLAWSCLRLLASHPRACLAVLRQALGSGARTARSRVWQLFYLAEAMQLVQLMRRAGLRHVHVHLANNAADVARLAVRLGTLTGPAGEPPWSWSLAVHGPTEFADIPGSDLAAKVRSASAVACISDFCRSQLMAVVEPAHWGKLGVVRMSVEPLRYPSMAAARAARPAGPLRLLFVGRLVPEKGPALLLDALAGVARRAPGSVEARIVGTGPLAGALAAQVASLGLSSSVRLLGPLGQDDLPDQYAWADAFCLPSFAEGLPVVLMEAMATGLPVITTRIAGIPELVSDGDTGLLVAPGRADALAGAIERVRDDPGLRRRIGDRAASAVRSAHDPDVNAAALRTLLRL